MGALVHTVVVAWVVVFYVFLLSAALGCYLLFIHRAFSTRLVA